LFIVVVGLMDGEGDSSELWGNPGNAITGGGSWGGVTRRGNLVD
jgi:hypothetical protein